jgi:cytoskeletal protein RodZ
VQGPFHRCPFLGLKDDPETWYTFPADENVCHRARRKVDLKYQKLACLTEDYWRCPIYQSAHEWRGAMPQALTPLAESTPPVVAMPAPVQAVTPAPDQPVPEAEPELIEPEPEDEADPLIEAEAYTDFAEAVAAEPEPASELLIDADEAVEDYFEEEPAAEDLEAEPVDDEPAPVEPVLPVAAVTSPNIDTLEPSPKPAAVPPTARRRPLVPILGGLLVLGCLIGAGVLYASGALPFGAQPDPTTDPAVVPSASRTVAIPTATITTPTTAPISTDTPGEAPTDPPTDPAPTEATVTSRATSEPIQMQLRYDTNLRAGPGTDFDIVRLVEAGIRVLVIGRDQLGVWVAIRLIDGTEGWVAASQLTGDGNILDAPIITALPPTQTATPED